MAAAVASVLLVAACGSDSAAPTRAQTSGASSAVPASQQPEDTDTTVAPPGEPGASNPGDEQKAAPPGCRNSTDPSCGEFSWDPQPENKPMTFDASVSTTTPKAGEPITVTMHAADADATVSACPEPSSTNEVSGDGYGGCFQTASCRVGSPRYGPWDPPPPASASEETWSFTVTFTTAGRKTITLSVGSVSDPDLTKRCDGVTDPYASDALREFEIQVG